MKPQISSLNKLPIGTKGQVLCLETEGTTRRRLLDLGIIQGTTIEALQKSPFGDPVAYCIRGTVIALRHEDAEKIVIKYLL